MLKSRTVEGWRDRAAAPGGYVATSSTATDVGHYLHDLVLPHLASLEMRYDSIDTVPGPKVREMLGDLQNLVRCAQVDILADAGTACLIDLIQPAVALAVRNDVEVSQCPNIGDWSDPLPALCARMIRRFVSTTVGNAVVAGASWVSIVARRGSSELTIEVEDNAGGFDPTNLPRGRGLERLTRSLGSDALIVTRTDVGSLVTAFIQTEM